jgi:hypothetical protein
MLLEGGFAVDISRRTYLGDDSFHFYVFSKQFSVFVVEEVHIVLTLFPTRAYKTFLW